MKAIIHDGAGLAGARYTDVDVPRPDANQVRVRLKVAALNHRDIWVCLGRTADMPAVVLGDES